ncbi:MAG TPA: MDR family MFS transporter [Candidatus Saccharimonadales bacterium]|nr:MDR family MFS transporter [Candidatus Saccharimonadales bacterium]
MLQHLEQKQKIIIMAAVMTGMFLAALDQTIVGTALPKILSEFNALKELSWVVTAYLLASTIAVPIAGKLSDLYGRRKLLLSGVIIFVVASLLCGISQNIEQLIALRALQGIGGGILFANAFTVIGDLFNMRERGKWQGIIGAVFGLSSLVGPLLGGYLTDGNPFLWFTTDWRWAFFINVPLGAIAFALIARYLPTFVNKAKKVVIDYLGAVLLSLSLGCLVLACSLGGTEGWAWNSLQTIGLFVGAAVTGGLFIWAEKKAKEPIIPLHLFANKTFALVCVLMLLFGMAFFGAIIYIPTFAQQILNFSATNSGIILLPMIVSLTAGSIVVGQIVNKTGKYKVFVIGGLALATIGVWTLSTLTAASGYWDLLWRMTLTGVGLGMSMPLFNLIAQNSAEQKDLGVASSAVQLFRNIGSTVGLAILGGVMNNALTQKLSNIQNEPFVAIANQSGFGEMFKNFDINAVQGVLNSQAIITGNFAELPEPIRQAAASAFSSFVTTLQTALAGSITQIFVISAVVMAVAAIISLFIKESPFKNHDELPPIEPA